MMTILDRRYVVGLFWRILAIGAALAMITAVVLSLRFGYSLALGALTGAASLRVTILATERMLRGAIQGSARSAIWTVVLALKLLLLFFAVWFCLVMLDAHPVAFVLGYKMILPALLWQSLSMPEVHDERDDDNESL